MHGCEGDVHPYRRPVRYRYTFTAPVFEIAPRTKLTTRLEPIQPPDGLQVLHPIPVSGLCCLQRGGECLETLFRQEVVGGPGESKPITVPGQPPPVLHVGLDRVLGAEEAQALGCREVQRGVLRVGA